MRKKLDTRFPAARIKKIMQADEDVGKIAMAVPLLVSKALELFLQDLCDRTYEITLRRGAKTMNSFHLKQCVQTFNVFDFLKDIVSKVPDLGGSAATADDRAVTKRRKVVEEDGNDSDDELKRSNMHEPGHTTGRGRCRGRGRHRGRRSRSVDREMTAHNVKYEDDPDSLKQNGKHSSSDESSENGIEPEEVKQDVLTSTMAEVPVRNFDLNLDLDENGDSPAIPAPHVPASSSANLVTEFPYVTASSTANPVTELPHVPVSSSANPVTELPHVPVSSSANPVTELRHEEYPGWSLSDVEKMTIDPMQLANLNRRIEDDEEDYDEES